MERNLQKNGLINAVLLLGVGVAGFIVARYANSLAGLVSVVFIAIGLLVAAVSWFQMRLEESERLEDTWVFHAGTDLQAGRLVTNGGRVLGVTTRAASLVSAVRHAYHAVEQIQWLGVHYRRDIGQQALQRVSA